MVWAIIAHAMGGKPLLVSEGGPALPRLLEGALADRLKRMPAVVVTGARQTGKTTIVKLVPGAERRAFHSLDSVPLLDRVRQDPHAFVESAPALTIDEVQRVPELLLAVKKAIDEDRKKGRFLLTGSANLLLLRRSAESLAGRALYLVLRPMTDREKRGDRRPPPWNALLAASDAASALAVLPEPRTGFDWKRSALAGGFPPAALAHDPEDRELWFRAYVDTFLHRDLQDFARIGDLPSFSRAMRLVALRCGGLVNHAEFGRDAGVPRTTAQRWISVLEASYLATALQPFHRSRAKRLIKSPKLYPGDTGLFLHLAGITDAREIEKAPNAGGWLEALVLNDLLAWSETEIRRPEVCFYRTANGEEIDFVVERNRRLLPIEIKASTRARTEDARTLEAFCAEHARSAPYGLLLYDGKEAIRLTRTTVAAPLASVL